MNGCIYKTTNNLNDKIYIGQTIRHDINTKYYLGSGLYLQRAIKKYGKENFTKEILKDNIHCQTALDLYEQIYIKKFNSHDKTIGYNIETGGHGRGRVSEETKQKIRNKRKLQMITDEHKKNMSKSKTGKKRKPFTDEHKKRISDNKIGKKYKLRKQFDILTLFEF